MDGEKTTRLFIAITGFVIVFIFGISACYYTSKNEQFIKAGYIQEKVPTEFQTIWVKPKHEN